MRHEWLFVAGLGAAACSSPPPPPLALTETGRRVVSVIPKPADELPYGAEGDAFERAFHARCEMACGPAARPGEKLVHCAKLDASDVFDEATRKKATYANEVYLCAFGAGT